MTTDDSTDDPPGTATWKEHTSAFDRVQSVALTVSEPRTASWIAEEALVAENTARSHLQRLTDLNVLTANNSTDATRYYPDPVYVRTRELRALVDEHDRDELVDLAADLKADIEEWQSEYDVANPDDVRVGAVAEEVSAEAARKRRRDASDWEHTRYRLSLVQDALEHYGEFTGRSALA
ncbi:ArsR family transcriptional regulator [Halostella sp. JP-L12]|uniref:DUF7342 family protein n=1 Tax=Halostella TaxID=1843185 RepID=UPI000EF770EF|nr:MULTISPECIES: ArsR family transcriptional regulator [Halostella]NHN48005.1 ArsR family transcriptional regulator [Halostella sp. JP-L12]